MSKEEPKLVVLKKFNTIHEANVVKSFLNSRGIEAVIFDEHTANLYATPAALFGIRLMVNSNSLDQANNELKDQELLLKEVEIPVQGIPCPNCNSTSTEITDLSRKSTLWLLTSLFFMLPMMRANQEKWSCHSCKHTWTEQQDKGVSSVIIIVLRLLLVTLILYSAYQYIAKT